MKTASGKSKQQSTYCPCSSAAGSEHPAYSVRDADLQLEHELKENLDF